MSWEDDEWPDLSPEFPVLRPTQRLPERPEIPADIGAIIARAEYRRKQMVRICLGVGIVVFAAGLLLYRGIGLSPASGASLALLAVGLVVSFPLAALLALLFGPSWRQRQDHWQLHYWYRDRRNWPKAQP